MAKMIGLGLGLAKAKPASSEVASDATLLIMAGQSNAMASGTGGKTPDPSYVGLTDVFILNAAGTAWEAFQPGTNANPTGNNATAWGPEAGFAAAFRSAYPSRPLYIAKVALGGTSVEPVGTNDWSPNSTGELFEDLEHQVNDAKNLLANADVSFDVVNLWNQGEADSATQVKFDAYYGTDGTDGTWAAFIGAYRSRIDATGPFITVRIRPFTGRDSVSWAFGVRELDELWADQNAWFSVIDADFEGSFHNLHPGPTWIDGLGARAFHRWNGTYGANYPELNDTAPSNLTFTDVIGQAASTLITAAMPGRIEGINRGAPISITGGEYRVINDLDETIYSDWTDAAGVLHPYQRVDLRATSDATAGDTVDVTVMVGSVSDTWSITTATNAPTNTVLPDITGTFTTGEVISVSDGTWTGDPAPTFGYQWTRGGADISGATANTYTLVLADEGAQIGCTVTGSNVEGSSTVSATGEGTSQEAAGFPGNIADVANGAWYDGQSSAIVTGSSGSISDLSGNGYDLTPNSGDIATTTINGHTAIDFGADVLEATGLNNATPDAGFTVAYYGRLIDNRTAYLVSLSDASNSSLFSIGTRSQNVHRFFGSSGSNTNLGPSDTNVHSQIFVYDGANLDHWTDGVDTGTSAPATLSGSGVTRVVIGALASGSSLFRAEIGEIVIIPRALGNTEVQALHSYFAARWA